MSGTNQPFISVIIPTYDGQRSVGYTLSNLLLQTYPKDRFEIVIVDDGSSDRTLEVIALFTDEFTRKGLNMTLLKNEGKGACKARNVAIRASKGEIVAMTDQDIFLPPDWLAEIAVVMNERNTSGLYGDITTDLKNFVEPLNGTAINSKYLTANAAYRKDVLIEAGAFSEEFPFFRGDSDLAYRIIRRGYKIEHAPSVIAYHPLRKLRWKNLWGFIKWSMYDPLLYKRHPRLVSEDVLKQVLPRFTPEGLAFTSFIAVVCASAAIASPILTILIAFAMISAAVATLSVVRSSLKDKPWIIRFEASLMSLVVYLPIVLGRLAGSIRYRKFIL